MYGYEQLLACLIVFALFVFITVALFIICRQLTLWYFRINHIADALESIDARLAAMAEKEHQ